MGLKDQKDVLIAWINGETLQYLSSNGTWSDCLEFYKVNTLHLDEFTYRIKPKEIVSRTFIKREYDGTHTTCTGYGANNLCLIWSPDGKTLIKAEVI